MRAVKSLLLVSCLLLPACKKDKAEAPPQGSATTMPGSAGSADTGSAAATMPGSAGSAETETAGSGQLQDVGSAVDPTAMSHHAQHCPSMVRGASTTSKLEGMSVIVTITSDDQVIASKIQMRTEQLLKDKAVAKLAGDEPTPVHAQNGTHGGGIGICPVHVPEGANAKSTTLANGVAIKITPKSGAVELAKDIEQRIARAAEWVKNNSAGDGDGTGHGGGSGTGAGSGNGHHGHHHT